MNTSHQSKTLPVVSSEPLEDELVQAATVACAYLEMVLQRKTTQPMRLFYELASRTLERAQAKRGTEFSAENLKQGIAKDAVKDPSAWISPFWTRLTTDEPTWQEGLREVAKQRGLSYIPKLGKRSGSPAYYYLSPVEIGPIESGDATVALPAGGLRYTPEMVAPPAAWLSSALRSGVVPWTVGVRWAVVVIVLGAFLTVVFGWAALIFVGLNTTRPLATTDLMSVFVLGAAGYLIYKVFMFFDVLFDQRIVMAPLFLTPLKQENVTLEFRNADREEKGIELAFVRYTATCPQCGGSISIYEGLNAFPDRLVGRCRRSAREHIYSFDPVLKIGKPLR